MHRATLLIPENFAVADRTRDTLKKERMWRNLLVIVSENHSSQRKIEGNSCFLWSAGLKSTLSDSVPETVWQGEFSAYCWTSFFGLALVEFVWTGMGLIILGPELSVSKSDTANILTGCPRKQKAHTLNADTQPQAGPIRLFLESSCFVWVLLHFKQWVLGLKEEFK